MNSRDMKPHFYHEATIGREVKRLRRQDNNRALVVLAMFLVGLGLVASHNTVLFSTVNFIINNIWMCLASWFAISVLMFVPFGLSNWLARRKSTHPQK